MEKVNVGRRAWLEPFCALAVSAKVVPTCREALGLGLIVIFAGNGEGPGGLLPPQAGKRSNKNMVTTIHADEPKRNLPMHPLVASRLLPMGEPLNGMENC
jgi:hypothetical protein